MTTDKTPIRKIVEDYVKTRIGYDFQEFANRFCGPLYPDYIPIRPAGQKGDHKNDGYCANERIFFQDYGTLSEKSSSIIIKKIKEDLDGCLELNRDVKKWIFLTNNDLRSDINQYIDTQLRPRYPNIKIEVWNHAKIAEKICELEPNQIEYITERNLRPSSYRYKYLNDSKYLSGENHYTETEKYFLQVLDRSKRTADDSLAKNIDASIDAGRLREINHYVFKIYRDLWFIQQKWYVNRSRYFQGIRTMSNVPDFMQDSRVFSPCNLSDQTDDWEDLGYLEEYAPVQLECHVYDGPSGHGFIIMARVNIDGNIWINKLHYGPESYRDLNNFLWIKVD